MELKRSPSEPEETEPEIFIYMLRKIVLQTPHLLGRCIFVARGHKTVHDGVQALLTPPVCGNTQFLTTLVVLECLPVRLTLAGKGKNGIEKKSERAGRSGAGVYFLLVER